MDIPSENCLRNAILMPLCIIVPRVKCEFLGVVNNFGIMLRDRLRDFPESSYYGRNRVIFISRRIHYVAVRIRSAEFENQMREVNGSIAR